LDFAKAVNLTINIVDYKNFKTATVQKRIEPRRGQCRLFADPVDSVLLLPVPRTVIFNTVITNHHFMNVDGFRIRKLLILWHEGIEVVSFPLHFVVMDIRERSTKQ
jgi:hypothetical protein